MSDEAVKKPSPRMSADEVDEYLTNAHTGILTTLRRDGVPISMPLWFAYLDGNIYARSRGKKLLRIRNDPRSSFLVESGIRWVELKAVHLTGTTKIVDADEDLGGRFFSEINRKYGEARATGSEMPKSSAQHYKKAVSGLLCFTPDDRVLNWDNAKLTQ